MPAATARRGKRYPNGPLGIRSQQEARDAAAHRDLEIPWLPPGVREELLLGDESIENLEKRIDNSLSECIAGLGDLYLVHIAGGQREIAPRLHESVQWPIERNLRDC